ncbi:hypothetical protein LJD17_15795 [Microvirga rosea]|nr:hypothetical protein [Microvirga rosea]
MALTKPHQPSHAHPKNKLDAESGVDPNNIHYKSIYYFIVELEWATFLSVYMRRSLVALSRELKERI